MQSDLNMCSRPEQQGPSVKESARSGTTRNNEDVSTDDASSVSSDSPSNEYVLNIAFLSFLAFTLIQLFFAIYARSQAMMADCAAMFVDVVTYLFNFLAERLKHKHYSHMSARDLRLFRLYLELVPPLISVATLVTVTILALRQALGTLLQPDDDDTVQPDLSVMFLFSGLNLLLDILNVTCFARVHQAVGVGLPDQDGHDHHHHHHDHDHHHHHAHDHQSNGQQGSDGEKTESTSLLAHSADEVDEEESITSRSINLNMCSAWTHVFADTVRSVAVIFAAGFSHFFPSMLSAANADSWAAIVVSIIILVSLAPLIQQLYLTACKIRAIWTGQDHDQSKSFVLSV